MTYSIHLRKRFNIREKVILVGVDIFPYDKDFERKLEETTELVEAANGEVVSVISQKRDAYQRAFVIGQGKIEELIERIEETKAESVLFNMELTGSHLRNLEEALNIKVIDRTMLILDIFASRAITSEGKLQVSLAQHEYRLSRLVNRSPYLSRLGGGIGTRGPGETKLESDRRHIQREIASYKKKLKSLKKHRLQTRLKRRQSQIPLVCLLGYTNAGKSSILNAMLQISHSTLKVKTKDMVFASLQPFTRRVNHQDSPFLISDTVGFVSDLPTHLVAAFESTLEEVRQADILIHVIDASNPQMEQQIETVQSILKDFDLDSKVTVSYFNKIDLIDFNSFNRLTQSDITLKGSALDSDDMKKLYNLLIQNVSTIYDTREDI